MKLEESERYKKKKLLQKYETNFIALVGRPCMVEVLYYLQFIYGAIHLTISIQTHLRFRRKQNILVLWFWMKKKWIVEPLDRCKWWKVCSAFEKKNQQWILSILNKSAPAERRIGTTRILESGNESWFPMKFKWNELAQSIWIQFVKLNCYW